MNYIKDYRTLALINTKGYCANAYDFNDALTTAKIASEILGIVYQGRFMQACGKKI